MSDKQDNWYTDCPLNTTFCEALAGHYICFSVAPAKKGW